MNWKLLFLGSAIIWFITPAWAGKCPHDTWFFSDSNAPVADNSNEIPDDVEKTFKLGMMDDVSCVVRKTEYKKLPGPQGQGTSIYQEREAECFLSKDSSVIFNLNDSDHTNGISLTKNGVRDFVVLGYCQ